MSNLMVGDTLVVKAEGKTYKAPVTRNEEGSLVTNIDDPILSQFMKDNVGLPRDIYINYERKGVFNFTPGLSADLSTDLPAGEPFSIGYIVSSIGDLTGEQQVITGRFDLETTVHKFNINVIINEPADLEEYPTTELIDGVFLLDLLGMEALGKTVTVTVSGLMSYGPPMEMQRLAGLQPGELEFIDDTTARFTAVIEEIPGSGKVGVVLHPSLLNLFMLARPESTYPLKMEFEGASSLTEGSIYYVEDDITGVVHTNFSTQGILDVIITPESVVMEVDPSFATEGDKYIHGISRVIGSTDVNVEDVVGKVEANAQSQLIIKITDPVLEAMYRNASKHPVLTDITFAPDDTPTGTYPTSPVYNEGGDVTWLATVANERVFIEGEVDSWGTIPSTESPQPWFDELLISEERDGYYLNSTAIEMVGRTALVTVQQRNKEDTGYLGVPYNSTIVQLKGRPFLELSKVKDEGALHNFSDWIKDNADKGTTSYFELELNVVSEPPVFEGDLLLNMVETEGKLLANHDIGVCEMRTSKAATDARPVASVAIESGVTKITYIDAIAQIGSNVVIREGQNVHLITLVKEATSPHLMGLSNNQLLSEMLMNKVVSKMDVVNISSHYPTHPYTLYGSESSEGETGYSRLGTSFGLLVTCRLVDLTIDVFKLDATDETKAVMVFDGDIESNVNRTIVLTDGEGNSESIKLVEVDGKLTATFEEPLIVANVKASTTEPYGFDLVAGPPPKEEELRNLLEQYIAAVNAKEDTNSDLEWLRCQDLLFRYHNEVLLLEREAFFEFMEYTHRRVAEEPKTFDLKRLFINNQDLDCTLREVRQFEAWISVVMLGSNKRERSIAVTGLSAGSIVKRFLTNDDQMQIAAWINHLKI